MGGHTDLEEELHEIAHIDYDRVAIVRSVSIQELLQLTLEPDCQSLGCRSLRRRSRVRDWIGYNSYRSAKCVLWGEDGPLTFG